MQCGLFNLFLTYYYIDMQYAYFNVSVCVNVKLNNDIYYIIVSSGT